MNCRRRRISPKREVSREAAPSTSKRGKPEKRLVVEILSDSEDEASSPREPQVERKCRLEGASAGILAMENLYKRIRRDTLGRLSPEQRESPSPGADVKPTDTELELTQRLVADREPELTQRPTGSRELELTQRPTSSRELELTQRPISSRELELTQGPISNRELELTQRLTTDHDSPILGIESPRTRSSSRDSNETLILPRRKASPGLGHSPIRPTVGGTTVMEKRGTATRKNPCRRNDARANMKESIFEPARAQQLAAKLTKTVQPSPKSKVPGRKREEAILKSAERSETKQLGQKKAEAKQPVLRKPEPKTNSPKKTISAPASRRVPTTAILTHGNLSFDSASSTSTAVSHEPFDFDVRLMNQKVKTALQKVTAREKKTVIKRLTKTPLIKKKPVKISPVKKITKAALIEDVKQEPEPHPPAEKVVKSEFTTSESIDVDEQHVSPLMSDGLWDHFEVISKKCSANYTLVKSIISMIEKGFTLPFICRYRRDQSGGLSTEVIQSIRDEYVTLIEVRKKAKALVAKLDQGGNRDKSLKQAILSARTLEELNVIMEPMKQKGRKTYAARARSIGMEDLAMPIWRGEKVLSHFRLENFIDKSTPGRSDVEDLLQSIRHILADELRRSRTSLDRMEEISRNEAELHVKHKRTKVQNAIASKETSDNFRDYFDFVRRVSSIESHQTLAINRGEQHGFLTVSVQLLPFFEKNFKGHLAQQFHRNCHSDPATKRLIIETVDDSYERLCKPYITRVARAHLKERADKEALSVFSANLRALLMTPPVRGESVLGIDPGFAKGCKLAVLSKSGELLESAIMYLTNRPEQVLTHLVKKYNCYIVAVGDGKGGQEVKTLLTSCNKRKLFGDQPVRFSTVREAGVSIYSVSKAAEEELPGLDCFVRGAVAIARRLQDPLVEFIKVEPKNLGIGMYQHDINESRLKEALQSTVVECVSYVGVDINVCPEFLLRQVAGLNATAAKNIIAHRRQHGPFKNREQLQQVPHIGPKRYEQCAGFVKILPETLKQCLDESLVVVKVQKPNEKAISEELEPLDTTIIHPESYALARRIIADLGLSVKNIGTPSFIGTITGRAKAEFFAQKFDASLLTVELILKALKVRRNWDIRDEGSAPIFCAGTLSMANIQVGQKVSGRVENVVPFGAFVDIAMNKDALIHNAVLGAARGIIKLGDIVECRVIKKDMERQRISLAFENFR